MERLMAQIDEFAVRQQDVVLEALDAVAHVACAFGDRESVLAVRTVYVTPVAYSAGGGIKSIQPDATVQERVASRGKVDRAMEHEHAPADGP